MTTIDELLALDLLTLRQHTLAAGANFDPASQRAMLAASLAVSQLCAVRRAGALVAYAMLRPHTPHTPACWLVLAFNLHPQHRSAAVLAELLAQVGTVLTQHGAQEVRSHVYQTNALSLAFHRRLGFSVTRENEKAVEFTATVGALLAHPVLRRSVHR
ncbi:MAG: GNAT family N-acetyltransferase [Burkholderiales bacterium]|nr:GNAT family N-acetyltransferase [Burkholderiales bacterium]